MLTGKEMDSQRITSNDGPLRDADFLREREFTFPSGSYVPWSPVTFTLELTTRCNQKCSGCGNYGLFNRRGPFLSGEEWIAVLERIKPYACYVRITGGECTLHPDFHSIMAHLDTLDIPHTIFSNFVNKKPGELVGFLKKMKNLTGLLISVHGPDARTHQAFTHTNHFDDILANIQLATQAGLTVNTNTVLTRENWNKIGLLVEQSHRLGASSAIFSRYYGTGMPLVDLSELELRSALANIKQYRRLGYHTKINPCIPLCFDEAATTACGAGFSICTVGPQGEIRPCNHASTVFGSIFQEEIPEIWASPAAQAWRSLLPPVCDNCAIQWRCRGGCRATAMHEVNNADPLIRQPILDTPYSSQVLRLYAGLRPIPHFRTRLEPHGALLIHYNHFVAVTPIGLSAAKAMDGQHTLADLSANFGAGILRLAIDLYQQGLIDFAE